MHTNNISFLNLLNSLIFFFVVFLRVFFRNSPLMFIFKKMMSYQMMSFSKKKPRPFSKTPGLFQNPRFFKNPWSFSKTPVFFKNPWPFSKPQVFQKPLTIFKNPDLYQKPGLLLKTPAFY